MIDGDSSMGMSFLYYFEGGWSMEAFMDSNR